jgi:[citrate (pro-3S)-lyase] ligase
MCAELEFYSVVPSEEPDERAEIETFLLRNGLSYEQGIEIFVVGRHGRKLVACGGLEQNIVKCVATDPLYRGEHLSLTIVDKVIHLAYERGHSHLFLYTRPNNIAFFSGCGFYPIVEVPGLVTLLENSPIGIRRYCDGLAKSRQPGARIGAAVLNANPFTRGHRYLIEQAAKSCDWLHVFVVAEDASLFPYCDRFQLMKLGIEGIERVTLHPGSQYMISRATFSCYFFKEKNVAGDCFTAVDLLIFREWIAPALGITHRFVGTEPFCRTTNKYNEDMKYWLQADLSAAKPVNVVEIPRIKSHDRAISASEVRRLLGTNDFDRIAELVPQTTYDLLSSKYRMKAVGPHTSATA